MQKEGEPAVCLMSCVLEGECFTLHQIHVHVPLRMVAGFGGDFKDTSSISVVVHDRY